VSLIILLFVVLVGATSSKSPRLSRFKSDRNEIWPDCYSSNVNIIDFDIAYSRTVPRRCCDETLPHLPKVGAGCGCEKQFGLVMGGNRGNMSFKSLTFGASVLSKLTKC